MGVEYKELQHICQLRAGNRITKSMMKYGKKYTVIGGSIEPAGYYFDFNVKIRKCGICWILAK